MPSRSRRPGRLDGLKVRISDDPAAPGVDVGRVLKTLARLLVRTHQHAGDHQAIVPVSPQSSTLTVAPNPSPDHETNEAA